jgi:hypothetical protein
MPFPVKWELVGRQSDRASESGRAGRGEANDGVGADNVPVPAPSGSQIEEKVLLRVVEVLSPIFVSGHVFVDGNLDRSKVDTIVLDLSDD